MVSHLDNLDQSTPKKRQREQSEQSEQEEQEEPSAPSFAFQQLHLANSMIAKRQRIRQVQSPNVAPRRLPQQQDPSVTKEVGYGILLFPVNLS